MACRFASVDTDGMVHYCLQDRRVETLWRSAALSMALSVLSSVSVGVWAEDSPAERTTEGIGQAGSVPHVERRQAGSIPHGTFLTRLVLENLPDDFEETKNWGGQRERWDGLHVKMDGLKVRTKRRKKLVNHGTWKRYEIQLVDPEEHLLVKITDWEQEGLGNVGFDLNLAARIHLTGRRQKWNNGVRVYSVTAEAVADVRLTIGMQVATKLDPSKFPPDVILEPIAERAVAELIQFKLHRISHADGPLVRELGDGLEKLLRKKLAEKNEGLVEKINRQFAKKQDDLRLSINDLVKDKWLGIEPEE